MAGPELGQRLLKSPSPDREPKATATAAIQSSSAGQSPLHPPSRIPGVQSSKLGASQAELVEAKFRAVWAPAARAIQKSAASEQLPASQSPEIPEGQLKSLASLSSKPEGSRGNSGGELARVPARESVVQHRSPHSGVVLGGSKMTQKQRQSSFGQSSRMPSEPTPARALLQIERKARPEQIRTTALAGVLQSQSDILATGSELEGATFLVKGRRGIDGSGFISTLNTADLEPIVLAAHPRLPPADSLMATTESDFDTGAFLVAASGSGTKKRVSAAQKASELTQQDQKRTAKRSELAQLGRSFHNALAELEKTGKLSSEELLDPRGALNPAFEGDEDEALLSSTSRGKVPMVSFASAAERFLSASKDDISAREVPASGRSSASRGGKRKVPSFPPARTGATAAFELLEQAVKAAAREKALIPEPRPSALRRKEPRDAPGSRDKGKVQFAAQAVSRTGATLLY